MKSIKSVLLLVILVLSFSLQAQQDAMLSKLAWIEGTWIRTNTTRPDRVQTETWKAVGKNSYKGQFVTIQHGDTVFKEKFTLLTKDKALFYVADLPENGKPVYFRLTALATTGFICENPAHDFPKKITYKLTGEHLTTTITDGYQMIEYVFKKKID